MTSVLPRGGDSDYTLVLVDGVRVNAFGGGFDFSQLALADVDRIEIVRGPQSALFGSDAIGAVVQIVTRQGGPLRVDGLVEGGSLDTSRLAAATCRARAAAGAGAPPRSASRRTASRGIAPATGERVTNDDWRSTHVSGTSRLAQSRQASDVRGHAAVFTTTDRGLPGPVRIEPDRRLRRRRSASRAAQTTTGPDRLRAWQHPGRRRRARPAERSRSATSTWRATSRALRLLFVRHPPPERPRADGCRRSGRPSGLSVGLEVQREEATSHVHHRQRHSSRCRSGASSPGCSPRCGTSRTSGCRSPAGVRVEYIRRDSLESNADSYSPRPGFDDRRDRVAQPEDVDVVPDARQPREWTTRRAGGPASCPGRACARARAPGSGPRTPSRSRSPTTPASGPSAAAASRSASSRRWPARRSVVDVTAFYNRYDDLIVAVGPAMGDISRYRTDNISNATAARPRGVGSRSGPPGGSKRAWPTPSWLDAGPRRRTAPALAPAPFAVGQPLLRRPWHQGSLDVVYARGRVGASARSAARGRVLDVEPTLRRLRRALHEPPATRWPTRARPCGWPARSSSSRRVTNLFNRRYEETLGFPALRPIGAWRESALLRASNVSLAFGGRATRPPRRPGLHDVTLDVGRGEPRRHPRAERLGQDHAAARARGHARPAGGPRHARRRRTSGRMSRAGRRAPDGGRAAGDPPRLRLLGARDRADGPVPAPPAVRARGPRRSRASRATRWRPPARRRSSGARTRR